MTEPVAQPAAQPAAPAANQNTAALIGLGAGVVGLFVLPILLGPLAIISGIVGMAQKDRGGVGQSRAAIVLGALALIVMMCTMSAAVGNTPGVSY